MKKAQLFVTCLVDMLTPEVGLSVADVLEKAGVEVEVPEGQTCCGQPAFNGGFWDEARAMARHTIDVFGDSDIPVVIPSGSCTYMVVHHYPELFAGDSVWLPRAEKLSKRTFEFTQFLVDVLGITDLGAKCQGKFTYHFSCHQLRGIQVEHQPLTLLSQVAGIELAPMAGERDCCGFGGLFSVRHPELSSAMLQGKLDNIVATGAQWVVGCDASCLLHLNGGLRRRNLAVRGVHIAQVLAGKVV